MSIATEAKTPGQPKEKKNLKRLAAILSLGAGDKFKNDLYYRITNISGEALEFEMLTTANGDLLDREAWDDPNVQKSTRRLKLPPKGVKAYNGEVFRAIGKDTILEKVYDEKISFQALDLQVNTNYRISNRTARRLGIQNYNKSKEDLVIPPFGTRSVNSDLLRWYRFQEWQRQDLVRVEREDQVSNGPGNLETLWNWIKLLPGLVLVALIGFGVPLWVVYHFGSGDTLIEAFRTGKMFSAQPPNLALKGLGRLFQVGFICVASILPALFYYLFGRQQVEKLRQKFFHDVLVLDPHIYTLSEAESKYDTLLNSAYGSSGSPFAILLLMFSTTLLVAGWTWTIAPYDPVPQGTASLVDFFLIKPSPLTLGFLGAYFFSINMIFRRYVRADLTPKTYAYITVRMLITFVLVWSISTLPEFSGSIMKDGFLPVAFIIGVFPENGFRMIRDFARKIMKESKKPGAADEKYPLTDLEGLNQYDQARLLEEGIENIENLAHHNLIELLAFTRIPTARLVDMFDQAILYLHLGLFDEADDQVSGDATKPDPTNVESENSAAELTPKPVASPTVYSDAGRVLLNYLKSFGVRTATDLIKLIDSREDPKISDVIQGETKIAQLRTVRITFGDDEWLSYILNWRKESSKEAVIRASFVNDPYHFYETGSPDPKKANEKGNNGKQAMVSIPQTVGD